MAFTVFANSTTVSASEMNSNFYYVAQGTRLPFTQTAAGSLAAVDATYDLGASATTWNTLYANNLNLSGSITTSNRKVWSLLTEVTLSATAYFINISGLNYLNSDIKIIGIIKTPTGTSNSVVRLIFNSIGAGNFYTHYIEASITSVSAIETISAAIEITPSMGIPSGLLAGSTFFNMSIKKTEGTPPFIICDSGWFVENTTTFSKLRYAVGTWNDTSSITNFTVQSGAISVTNYAIGTNIQVWVRK